MSYNTTNLGKTAQTDILVANTEVKAPTDTATTQMISPSFSQVEIAVGTAASPSATLTVAYVAGTNKYIFYTPLTTATAINNIYEITGLPANFPAIFSVVAEHVAVASATFGTAPIVSNAHSTFSGTTLFLNPKSSTSPVFASGTAYIKLTVSFTLD
jgi:hypothetical protein